MNNKANTFKLRGFRSAMVNNRDIERGTSDAAPIRSRHRKKALCFQTEFLAVLGFLQ